ncbi:MAG: vWA domain-containing protein [Thermoplasmatota archaeon]
MHIVPYISIRRGIPCLTVAVIAFSLFLSIIGLGEADGYDAYTGGGYLETFATSDSDSIWRADSENNPNSTEVSLRLAGSGTKGITLAPQDVVFLMDHSGSLGTYDPQVLRIIGAKRYVDNMIAPFDRAVVIKFDTFATPVGEGHHLTNAYAQVAADLEALASSQPQGQTNFEAGIDLAIQELITHGLDENQKIIVFFTDGTPDPPEANVTITQMDQMVDNEIKMFTIGLGPDVDGDLLGWMAQYTGGDYFHAKTADELVDIYLKISDQFYDYTAGRNCTIEAHLDGEFDYVLGSSNRTVGFEANETENGWVLKWNTTDLKIGEDWTVGFEVESPDGDGKFSLFKRESRVIYESWRGEGEEAELPDLQITVQRALPPPLPPPPPAPMPAPVAPVPPPPSVPVVAPSVNVAPVITATPNITPVTIGQTATVPVEYMLAGLAALGIAERSSIRKKIIEKQKVSVGA